MSDAASALDVLTRAYLSRHPDEAAAVLDAEPLDEAAAVLAAAAPVDAAATLERLTSEVAAAVVERLEPAAAARILEATDAARAATVIARLAPEDRRARLALLAPGTAREIESLLEYPPNTAGQLMDPRLAVIREDATVEEGLARIRARRSAATDALFLVDGEGRLRGVVSLASLACAAPGERLDALVHRAPATVGAMDTREEIVERLGRSDGSSLPVVDVEGRLLGAIRHDAIVAAAQEEASADIQTMVGASREERALSKPSFAVRKRLPWLQINLVTAFLAASVVGIFEETIARTTALAVLLPVVAGQSGNTGAQALAVTMRGLALREIRLRHWITVARKEVSVAFVNGIAVALTTSLGVYVWSRSAGIALVIGLSMVISMVAAGLSGAAIPMILTALKQDPAQSSSIVLTTVTDVVGFFSFLGIATMLAGML
jgi:magnesium transporter